MTRPGQSRSWVGAGRKGAVSCMVRLSDGRSLEPQAQLCGVLCREKEVWDTERDVCDLREERSLGMSRAHLPKVEAEIGQGSAPTEAGGYPDKTGGEGMDHWAMQIIDGKDTENRTQENERHFKAGRRCGGGWPVGRRALTCWHSCV